MNLEKIANFIRSGFAKLSQPDTVGLILGALGVLALGLAIYRLATAKKIKKGKFSSAAKTSSITSRILLGVILLLLSVGFVLAGMLCIQTTGEPQVSVPEVTEPSVPEETQPTEPEEIISGFAPVKTASGDPENWGITWEIFEGTRKVTSYNRKEPIFFGEPEDYFALPGISTFRGNNYRNDPTYGYATVSQKTLQQKWQAETGTLAGNRWGGCGWTGQPLIVQWDAQTRKNMNLYPDKKAKDGLVEIIYATLDGKIYFLDLDDGKATRDPINIGLCFKGAGTLDPRGYPLLYVGTGDVNIEKEKPRMFIISLITGKVLYEYGNNDPLSLRIDGPMWSAFDSAPLIHAETDTLIWPGESGVLYTMKLNSRYDKNAGSISIDPDNMVRTRYSAARSNEDTYWRGYEPSANIIENYLYISENGGLFFCIDLNTMELVWVQDTKDDSNSTPVFEYFSDQEAYVYTAPSLHWTKDSQNTGVISIYKLNALTGEIVWEVPYNVHTVSGVSGGIQSSPLLGRPGTKLEGMIVYTIARTPLDTSGIMVALDTKTGKEIWRMDMKNYAWSSPVPVYTQSGDAYIVVCDSMGYMFLVDGTTGKQLYLLDPGGWVEASPAVYNNYIVIGYKRGPIRCIEIQ